MKTTVTPEQASQAKRGKFFTYLDEFISKEEKHELINLTQIYEDHGSPRYKSPKRRLHYPRGKAMIQYEIQRNNNEVEKVIRYDGNTIYGNYNLALTYLREIDAYYYFLFTDFLMRSEPDILEKYFNR